MIRTMTNLFSKSEWTTKVGDGPDGWSITWRNGPDTLDGAAVDWKAPRVEVAAPSASAPGGVVHFKLENGAFWADITQLVNVTAGAVYRLSIEAEPQLRHAGNPAGDPLSGEIAAYTGANQVWRGTDAFPNNVWTPFALNVTPVGTGQVRLGWSVRLRHQLDQNWYHLREPLLELVSAAPAPNDTGTGDADNPPTPTKKQLLQQRAIILGKQLMLIGNSVEAARIELQNLEIELGDL